MKRISFSVCQTPEQTEKVKFLIKKAFSPWRAVIGATFSAVMFCSVLFLSGDWKPVSMLLAIDMMLFFMMIAIVAYTQITKRQYVRSAEQMQGVEADIYFDLDSLTIQARKERETYPYKRVIGQYWCEDIYFITVDDHHKRRVVFIPVDKSTFDNLGDIIEYLKAKKKIVFIQLKGNS